MNEKILRIKTKDNFFIHGVLNQISPSNVLLIFVHGLTGEKENHLYYNGARYFPAHDVHTFRFDLFSNGEKGRTLSDCSISGFAADLNDVVDYFADDYGEIHVVGHSIGGCAVMNSNTAYITSLVLWDTALSTPTTTDSKFAYNEHFDKYIAHLKIEYFLSKQLIEERSHQDEQVVAKVKCPMKLIFAGNNVAQNSWESRKSSINVHHQIVTIEGAGHGFNEYGVDAPLLLETLQWIQTGHKA